MRLSTLRMNTIRYAVVAGIAGVIAACGSTTPAPGGASNGAGNNGGGTNTQGGGSNAGGQQTGTLQVSYNLTGSVTASGSFKQVLDTGVTCANFVQYGDKGIPPEAGSEASFNVTGGSTVSGDTYSVDVTMSGYHGAGSYDNSDPKKLVDVNVQINNGDKGNYSSPQSAGGSGSVPSPVNVTVNGDGSGNATFKGLADNNGSGGTVDGTAQWTCS